MTDEAGSNNETESNIQLYQENHDPTMASSHMGRVKTVHRPLHHNIVQRSIMDDPSLQTPMKLFGRTNPTTNKPATSSVVKGGVELLHTGDIVQQIPTTLKKRRHTEPIQEIGQINLHEDEEGSKLSVSSLEVAFSNPVDRMTSLHYLQDSNKKDDYSKITIPSQQYNIEKEIAHPPKVDDSKPRTAQFDNLKRDDYVYSGVRFRSLLDNAFQKATNGLLHSESNELTMSIVRDKSTLRKRRKTMSDMPQDDLQSLGRRRLDFEDTSIGVHTYDKCATDISKEKTEEILRLKRTLKEAEEHAKSLTCVNSTLRDASVASSSRIETITEALRIAGQNAANAKADADAAEEKSASLQNQMKSMQTIVNETKRSCEIVRKEHDTIASASRELEGNLRQAKSELGRIHEEKRKFEDERDHLRKDMDKLEQVRVDIQRQLDDKMCEISRMKRILSEKEIMDKSRIDRTHRAENELRDVKAVLIEATSTATESESTITLLNASIKELQRENKSLHDKISDAMNISAKDRLRFQEALSESEREVQMFRMKSTNDGEEMQRLKLDQASCEKENLQLKKRINNLERLLTKSSSITDTDELIINDYGHEDTKVALKDTTSMQSFDIEKDKTSSITETLLVPKSCMNMNNINRKTPIHQSKTMKATVRDSTKMYLSEDNKDWTGRSSSTNVKLSMPFSGKENISDCKYPSSNTNRIPLVSVALNQEKCCICHKSAYGIMKSCQCGRPDCDKRAHASCLVAKNPSTSVSYPGTPSPVLPHILCKGLNHRM